MIRSPALKSQILGPAFVLVIVWFSFVAGILGPGYSFAISQDNEFLLGPILAHMSSVVRTGEWPLWMDSILGGAPLYNMTQLSAFYPFYLTFLPIYGDIFETSRSMHLLTLGHVLLFLVNSFILLRSIGVSKAASVAGAVVVVFNVNTLAYSTWINIIAPYAWLPLYIAGLVSLLTAPTSWRAQALTLFSIAMLTLASPAQPLIHAVLLTLVIVFAHALNHIRRGKRWFALQAYLCLAAITCTALLLLAPVLLPALGEFGGMIRWVGPFPPVIGHDRIPFEAFLTDQIPPSELAGTFFRIGAPLAVGSQFIGILPLVLAGFAIFSKDRHWLVLPLAFVAIYSLLSSTGSHLGFAQINYHIPLLDKIREPSRFLVLAHFAVGILVAIALDKLGKFVSSADRNEGNRGVGFAIAIAGVGILIALSRRAEAVSSDATLFALFSTGTILAVAIGLRLRLRASGRAFVLFCSAIVVATQWVVVPWRAPEIASMDYLTGRLVGLEEVLRAVARRDPTLQYRVIFEGGINKQQAAMLAAYQGIRSFNSSLNPAPLRQFEQLYYHGARTENYFRALGAKFMICQACSAEGLAGYEFVERVGMFSIYETTALPRIYVATQVAGEYQSLGEYAEKMAKLDLRANPVLVSAGLQVPLALAGTKFESDCMTGAIAQTTNSVNVAVHCPSPALFVLNEFDNGNWQAHVDGRPVKTLSVNGNQIGVALAAGAHYVSLRYVPKTFSAGLWASFFALLIIGMTIFVHRATGLKRTGVKTGNHLL